MMKRAKLRTRQQKMFAKHHAKPRPYDYARGDAEERRKYRIFRMFRRGMSDESIAKVTGMSEPGVRLYREVVYWHWITTHHQERVKRGQNGV